MQCKSFPDNFIRGLAVANARPTDLQVKDLLESGAVRWAPIRFGKLLNAKS